MSKYSVVQNSAYYEYTIQALLTARKSFYASIFSYNLEVPQDDLRLVRNLTKLMARRKNAGIDVRVLLGVPYKDGTTVIESIDRSNEMTFALLKGLKVPVAFFNRPNYQCSHCKYYLVDNKLAVIGSHNFSPRALGIGFDDSIGIEDNTVAAKLKREFMSDWSRSYVPAADQVMPFNAKSILPFIPVKKKPSITTISDTGPVRLLADDTYFSNLMGAVDAAQRSIDIAMFYFSYSPNRSHITSKIFDSLGRAVQRGVRIRCMLDKDAEGDLYGSGKINQKRFDMLKQIGVTVKYDNKETVTHGKLVVIDKSKVLLGSHNWTAGSFNRFRDMSILIESPALADEYSKLYNTRFRSR